MRKFKGMNFSKHINEFRGLLSLKHFRFLEKNRQDEHIFGHRAAFSPPMMRCTSRNILWNYFFLCVFSISIDITVFGSFLNHSRIIEQRGELNRSFKRFPLQG